MFRKNAGHAKPYSPRVSGLSSQAQNERCSPAIQSQRPLEIPDLELHRQPVHHSSA
ncbi:MAG: hypothetical protein IPN76_19745 [Saprospiraceae bacterium]|nr:hypothetical protein [Saprospiraceae bacterium]